MQSNFKEPWEWRKYHRHTTSNWVFSGHMLIIESEGRLWVVGEVDGDALLSLAPPPVTYFDNVYTRYLPYTKKNNRPI